MSGNRAIRNSDLSYKPCLLVVRSMKTVYQVVWKRRYKKLGISMNHIIRTAIYGDQDKINQKLFLLNYRVHIRNDSFPTKIRKTFVKFFNIHPHCQIWVAKFFLEKLGHQQNVCTVKELWMTETNVVDGYEISWHVYINMLIIYHDGAFGSKINLILNPLTTISSY